MTSVTRVLAAIGMIAAALSIFAGAAQAQATRTWVSGVGNDADPCSRTAPCKTFAGAISKTAASGEINCLDPGGFGAVTITKAITIACEGVTAGVLAAGTNGIIVNAGASDSVTLRGLDINGLGTVNHAHLFANANGALASANGAILNVANSVLANNNFGANASVAGASIGLDNNDLFADNTAVQAVPGSAFASANNNKFNNNGNNGANPSSIMVIH